MCMYVSSLFLCSACYTSGLWKSSTQRRYFYWEEIMNVDIWQNISLSNKNVSISFVHPHVFTLFRFHPFNKWYAIKVYSKNIVGSRILKPCWKYGIENVLEICWWSLKTERITKEHTPRFVSIHPERTKWARFTTLNSWGGFGGQVMEYEVMLEPSHEA